MEEKVILDEALKYFKKEKGFHRLMIKIKEKYTIFDRENPGKVVIESPTKAEKQALSGFMKKDYSKNKTITISIKKFQERLEGTRFEGVTIKNIVEGYFGEKIIANKIVKSKKIEEFEDFIYLILEENRNKLSGKLLEEIITKKDSSYISIKTKYYKSKELLQKNLRDVCLCINNLPTKKTRLPVFSVKILKNPHGLDKNTETGRLFIEFLKQCEKLRFTKVLNESDKEKSFKDQTTMRAENLAELYYTYNLLIDDVSNMVLCKNILAYKDSIEHFGWKGFLKNNECLQVTLDNLNQIDKLQIQLPYAFVFENPAVFMEISDYVGSKKIPLVCTYGQIKLSGIVLLNMLEKQCKKIYYSGDTDPEGLQIADSIKCRYGDKVELIGFDVKTYLNIISNVKISDERLKKLDSIKSQELTDVSEKMKEYKMAGYEELKIEEIKRYVKE